MITVSNPKLSVSLPDRFHPGDVIDAQAAAVLQSILDYRLRDHAKVWLKNGCDPASVQVELENAALKLPFTAEPQEPVDPITLEARSLARAALLRALARNGVELDDSIIDRQVNQLAQTEVFRRQAEATISVRTKVALAALGGLK